MSAVPMRRPWNSFKKRSNGLDVSLKGAEKHKKKGQSITDCQLQKGGEYLKALYYKANQYSPFYTSQLAEFF
ncbi:hypothetical protein NCCP133_17690 [Cytobacillus sp. NCCP-133]|nr:hypothetical protein NCCP133_17690 [Cytobacillus sp. NCCP-133]